MDIYPIDREQDRPFGLPVMGFGILEFRRLLVYWANGIMWQRNLYSSCGNKSLALLSKTSHAVAEFFPNTPQYYIITIDLND